MRIEVIKALYSDGRPCRMCYTKSSSSIGDPVTAKLPVMAMICCKYSISEDKPFLTVCNRDHNWRI